MTTSPLPDRIAVLPLEVANQIAAGEVVERPASVLKELVENAIDAGARTINVAVDGGGITRLAVTDDGVGMSPKDLELSVVPHATSKIRTAEELFGVGTYGFRGEALASIGSVSRLRIITRPVGTDSALELVQEAGAPPTIRPASAAVGTTVSVEELFVNTPARRKFLRTPTTEAAACLDVLARLALPRPDIRFVLRRDGKVVREWLRQESVPPRARELFPDEDLVEMRGTRGEMTVLALLGPPEKARAGGSSLSLYVNGRHVKDRMLLRAVAQAYGSTLEPGRYPSGAVLLTLPPERVDVNVHPQKAEVRFAEPGPFGALVTILREALASAPWARTAATGSDFWTGRFTGAPSNTTEPLKEEPPAPPAAMSTAKASESTAIKTPDSPPDPTAPVAASTPLAAYVRPHQEADPWGLTPQPPYPPTQYALPTNNAQAPLPIERPTQEREAPVSSPTPAKTSEDSPGPGGFSALRYVSQLRKMFLLCEGEQGLVILDQHAAAERVTFDRLRKAYAARSVSMQPLLVPEMLEVTAREVALVQQHSAELSVLGVELDVQGPTTLAVRGVPALLVRADPRRLARDVLSELARQGNAFSRAMDLVLATMACHGSVRAGEELADEEARALLRSMDDADFAGHCPHGRPVLWTLRWSELERRVGR